MLMFILSITRMIFFSILTHFISLIISFFQKELSKTKLTQFLWCSNYFKGENVLTDSFITMFEETSSTA